MSSVTTEVIREALRSVPFPGFSRDIVSLGVVRQLLVDGDSVVVELVVQSREPMVMRALEDRVKAAVATVPNAGSTTVRFVGPTPARLPVAGKPAAPSEPAAAAPLAARIIGVASGKGGVGKSTVAVNLAVCLAQQGRRVGFLDADVHGPSAPLMFGLEGRRPERADADGRPVPLEAFGVRVMSMGFFTERGNAVIWRGPIVGNFIKQLLGEVAWGELDDLIIDFPPGTGDAQLTISQTLQLNGVVVVTTPNELALIDAVKAIAMFQKVGVPILGIVENMSYFVCDHCQQTTEIFGAGGGAREAQAHEVPLLGRIPIDPAVVSESDRGVPVVIERPESPAGHACRQIAQAVVSRTAARAESNPGLGAFLDRFGR
ncbi:MAG: Mrp/NBP35 family ATP-binding protein [Acidobacteriota bacterium]